MQKRRRGIGAAAAEHIDFQEELRVRVNRGIQPLGLAIAINMFLVIRDRRRRRGRRVGLNIRNRMRSTPDRTVGPLNGGESELRVTSRTDRPFDCSRIPSTLTGVEVRSSAQTSSQSMSYASSSNSGCPINRSQYDLDISQSHS